MLLHNNSAGFSKLLYEYFQVYQILSVLSNIITQDHSLGGTALS